MSHIDNAIAVFVVTTTYVMLGGLCSVVITDVTQTIILTLAAIVIMGALGAYSSKGVAHVRPVADAW